MSEINDLLTALRDVGVTTPRHGDAGDEQLRSALHREIAGPRRAHLRVRPRRRLVLRCSAVGALAAVAAGVVIATGVGGSATPRLAFSNANTPRIGSVRTQATAYVVKRVEANVAAAAQDGTVVRFATYMGGDVSADGSLANLGWKLDDGYEYAAPDGTEYSQGTLYYQDGSTELTTFDDWAPGATDALGTDTETAINPTTHQWSQRQSGGSYSPNDEPTPNLFSTPAQVQQALQGGQVTQQGTATVDGTQAIALSMVAPNAPGNPNTDIALYVDAQTYQPLRTVAVVVGAPDLNVGDWVPATPENIAMAKDESIPSGYTQATPLQVARATYDK